MTIRFPALLSASLSEFVRRIRFYRLFPLSANKLLPENPFRPFSCVFSVACSVFSSTDLGTDRTATAKQTDRAIRFPCRFPVKSSFRNTLPPDMSSVYRNAVTGLYRPLKQPVPPVHHGRFAATNGTGRRGIGVHPFLTALLDPVFKFLLYIHRFHLFGLTGPKNPSRSFFPALRR